MLKISTQRVLLVDSLWQFWSIICNSKHDARVGWADFLCFWQNFGPVTALIKQRIVEILNAPYLSDEMPEPEIGIKREDFRVFSVQMGLWPVQSWPEYMNLLFGKRKRCHELLILILFNFAVFAFNNDVMLLLCKFGGFLKHQKL